MPLRAFAPLDEPTATYVPHTPTAGRTAVGIRKDLGLFPAWTLLCYSKKEKEKWELPKQYIKSIKINQLNKDEDDYRVGWGVLSFVRPGKVQNLGVQKDSWRSHYPTAKWFVQWAKNKITKKKTQHVF